MFILKLKSSNILKQNTYNLLPDLLIYFLGYTPESVQVWRQQYQPPLSCSALEESH